MADPKDRIESDHYYVEAKDTDNGGASIVHGSRDNDSGDHGHTVIETAGDRSFMTFDRNDDNRVLMGDHHDMPVELPQADNSGSKYDDKEVNDYYNRNK